MRTERRLLEESRYKSMILNIVDVFLFQCTLATSLSQINFILLLFGHIIISISHVNKIGISSPHLTHNILRKINKNSPQKVYLKNYSVCYRAELVLFTTETTTTRKAKTKKRKNNISAHFYYISQYQIN